MSFVTFEGIDGSGKSTQIDLLEQKLIDKNLSYTIFREPGGNILSEKIRSILLSNEYKISEQAETMLFFAARAQLVSENISSNTNNSQFIICDRFCDSTLAYQGYGKKINLSLIKMCNEFVTNKLIPDLTILMNIDYETSMMRMNDKKDRMESNSRIFFENVIDGYQKISSLEPDRFLSVDARLPASEIHSIIWNRVQKDFSL